MSKYCLENKLENLLSICFQVQSISTIIMIDYSDNKNIIEILTKIWIFVENAIIVCEGKQLNILLDLLITLLDVTRLGSFQDMFFSV